jgi:hypothetical protein
MEFVDSTVTVVGMMKFGDRCSDEALRKIIK